jgi:hypothetical protein
VKNVFAHGAPGMNYSVEGVSSSPKMTSRKRITTRSAAESSALSPMQTTIAYKHHNSRILPRRWNANGKSTAFL